MRQPAYRSGRSNGVFAIGLFLLSGLMALPTLQWAFRLPAEPPAPDEYKFAESKSLIPKELSGPVSAKLESSKPKLRTSHYVEDLGVELVQFETVFWEPNDTDSLRQWIASRDRLQGAQVLEIGTGTGLVTVCCLLHRAKYVVATDINPLACSNAAYNLDQLGLREQADVRLVSSSSPGPFSVVESDERFDFIISNPPWEDGVVSEVAAHALYDPGFALLDGILASAHEHLNDGGSLLLAYGARAAIERILETAPGHGWHVEIADTRSLENLPEVFLPGMLLVLTRR